MLTTIFHEFPILYSVAHSGKLKRKQYLIRDIKQPILFSPIFEQIFLSLSSWKRNFSLVQNIDKPVLDQCLKSLFSFSTAKTEKNS